MNFARFKRNALNQAINLFWTALCFTPIVWFWIEMGASIWLYVYIIVGYLFGRLPKHLLAAIKISDNPKVYESLGVKTFRKFVQNGDWVNQLTKTKVMIPTEKIDKKKDISLYLQSVAMYERFHWVCLVFFILTSIHAFLYGYYGLGATVLLSNLPYNVCAIMLQQYNRLRIMNLLNRLG